MIMTSKKLIGLLSLLEIRKKMRENKYGIQCIYR